VDPFHSTHDTVDAVPRLVRRSCAFQGCHQPSLDDVDKSEKIRVRNGRRRRRQEENGGRGERRSFVTLKRRFHIHYLKRILTTNAPPLAPTKRLSNLTVTFASIMMALLFSVGAKIAAVVTF